MSRDDQQSQRKVRHSRISLVGVALILWGGLVLFANESMPCPSFELASDPAKITDDELPEISGVAASRDQPGILWVHNDSGDDAMVYAIDLQGQLLAEVQLVDVNGGSIDAVDCEDMALGPGPDGAPSLYLADIGDNAAKREMVRLYFFPEPQIEIREDGRVVKMTAKCNVIEAVYPDGSRDAETLLVDPITADVVIVSKDAIHARAYRVPILDGGMVTLEFLVELPWGLMTGGDISSDGMRVLLRGYWNAEMWTRSSEGDWWSLLAMSGCPATLAIEQQGEAIGFSADGLGYFTISEGVQPFLYSYRILSAEPTDLSAVRRPVG
jgi:hypothetical protein